MRIVFFGTGGLAPACFDALLPHHEAVAVVTEPDRGRLGVIALAAVTAGVSLLRNPSTNDVAAGLARGLRRGVDARYGVRFSSRMGRGPRMWGFDGEERKVLTKATEDLPALRAVLDRATPRPDLAMGLHLVQATFNELDEMYSLVEQLMDVARSQRRLDLLDGLLASLCSSLDSDMGL